MWHAVFPTPLGAAAILWHDAGVTGFRLPGDEPDHVTGGLAGRGERVALEAMPAWIAAIATRVQEHFAGTLHDFLDVPLDWTGVGAFQREVYRQTQTVKPGRTCSYGDIARSMGLPPASSRAVGTALGSNPWPLFVPCHRVVSSSGKMTGFSAPGGIRMKTRLLALEGAELPLA